MRWFIYILSDTDLTIFHIGYTSDISKTMKFYSKLPPHFDFKKRLNMMVYLEEITLKTSAMERFKEVTGFKRSEIENLIEAVNPNYIELIPGVNIEL